jgi:hypothetical protein
MGLSKFYNEVLIGTQRKLEDFIFKCTYRTSPKDFSRERKMGFKEIVLFMLNAAKKSLQIELNNFFENVLRKDTTIKKQAYSAAREKIKPEIFIELADDVNKLLYNENDKEYETWEGYRLSAIDGSVLEIPNTKELRDAYGYSKSKGGQTARAKALCIYDVINKIILKSKIDRFTSSERKMSMELIKQMLVGKKEKELMLFDRGFPSAELIGFLIENGIDFLMRAQRNFSNDIMNAKDEDQLITIKNGDKLLKIRVLRLILDSGEEEILLTSLIEAKYIVEDFKKLYFKRWGIEVKFDGLKNKLEIENFTGTTKIAIEQDFYASIYLSNMVELAKQHNEEIIREKNKGKELKYDQKTNLNILVGSLKDKFVLMILEKNTRKRNKMFKAIMSKVSQSTIPIRPERQNKRLHKRLSNKYKTNGRRCL